MRLSALFILILLFSCSSPEPEEPVIPFEDQKIPFAEKIKQALTDEYLSSMGFSEMTSDYLVDLYSSNNYKPIWVNDSMSTELAAKVRLMLEDPMNFAVPRSRSQLVDAKNYIQEDISLSVAYSTILNDIDSGLIDFSDSTSRAIAFKAANEMLELVPKEDDLDSLRLKLLLARSEDTSYQNIVHGYLNFIDNYPLNKDTFDIETIKNDTIAAVTKTRLALISKGYILKQIHDSLIVDSALKVFQDMNGLNPDGVIGKYTAKCLNESNYNKAMRIILAMDKIKADRVYPSKFIRINIPEYSLKYYHDDTLRSQHNIVVGKSTNQTPELESKLRKIVVYPFWNVPYSISSKEILPSVKRNVGYLDKHHYKVYRKEELIDPKLVNWKIIRTNAFPYKVIQDPGLHNSLGIIKFDFYNSHSVYFHDTPAKGLFGADVRAYSHGCMRTQNPIDLAKEILKYDSLSPKKRNDILPDSLDSLFEVGENYEINVVDRFPIYIDYVTVYSTNGKMIIGHDVYGRDEKFIAILEEETTAILN